MAAEIDIKPVNLFKKVNIDCFVCLSAGRCIFFKLDGRKCRDVGLIDKIQTIFGAEKKHIFDQLLNSGLDLKVCRSCFAKIVKLSTFKDALIQNSLTFCQSAGTRTKRMSEVSQPLSPEVRTIERVVRKKIDSGSREDNSACSMPPAVPVDVVGDDLNISPLTPVPILTKVRPGDSPVIKQETETCIATQPELTESVMNSSADSVPRLPPVSSDHDYSVGGDDMGEKQQFNRMMNETTELLNSSGLHCNPLYLPPAMSEMEIDLGLINKLKVAMAARDVHKVIGVVSKSQLLKCAIKRSVLQELDLECDRLSTRSTELESVLQKDMDIFTLTKEAGHLAFRIIQEMSVR